MNAFTISIWLVLGIICAFINKEKGYSPVSGFCWGFFLSVIGLIVVLLEKTKEEHEKDMKDKKGLSMGFWLAIFLGVGIIGIIVFLILLNNGIAPFKGI